MFKILVLTCGLLSFCYASSPTDSSLLPSIKECGIGSIPGKINGNGKINAELDEFPWMVLINYDIGNGKKGFFCDGALISKRYILTAAHCVKKLPKNLKVVSVRLGEYNTATPIDCVGLENQTCAPEPLNVLVEEIIAHEEYAKDSNKYYDIALLRLAEEVTYNDFVSPICLPKTAENQARNYTGKRLTVAGWGQTEDKPGSGGKWKLDLPVQANEVCSKIYSKSRVVINDSQMCAGGEKGRDTCNGDGGAPLMAHNVEETSQSNWFVIGIVSFGASPCGMENVPGVYTKVANYVPWIVSKLKP